jgi:hypothetical protein
MTESEVPRTTDDEEIRALWAQACDGWTDGDPTPTARRSLPMWTMCRTTAAWSVAAMHPSRPTAPCSDGELAAVGVVVASRGRLVLALGLTIEDDKITLIDVIADPERLHELDLAILVD